MCRKSMLVTTLRRYGRDTPEARVAEWFPDSYLFYPAKPDRSEREQFLAAYEARAAAEPDGKNVWILKPSDGGKGEGIVIKVRKASESSRAARPHCVYRANFFEWEARHHTVQARARLDNISRSKQINKQTNKQTNTPADPKISRATAARS